MVKLIAVIFIFCLVFILVLNLHIFDFKANQDENKQASDFTLQDLDGKSVSLSDFKGEAVMLFFWTTWCPHCRNKVPMLNREYKNIKSAGIELLAINVNEPRNRIKEFADKNSIAYPVLLDSDGRVFSQYNVIGVPTFILISREGKVVFTGNSFPSGYKGILSR